MYWALQVLAERLTSTWWLSVPIAAVAVPQVDVTPPTAVTEFVKLKMIV
jgi:F0F1-type ATP synthase beta subunit